MCAARENILVIDISVLPTRPDVGKIKLFLDNEIHLQYAEIKSIQLHNTRNCVLIEMINKEVASRYQLEHNWKRVIVAENKAYKIPVYVDGEAVTVRVNDLSSTISDASIRECMLKFGEVISIRNETWKHYFPGIPNGVRVLRMNLFRHIPSCITIENELTTVSYLNQPLFCRRCNQPAHPNKKCVELPEQNSATISTVMSAAPSKSPSRDGLFNSDDFPPLSGEQSSIRKPTVEERRTQEDDNEWTDCDDNDNTSSSSTDYNVVTNKRRRSTRKECDAKKVCSDQCSHNAGHENEETIDALLKGKNAHLKNKSGKGVSFTTFCKK